MSDALKFTEKITTSDFTEILTNLPAVQDALNQIERYKAVSMQKYYSIYGNARKDKEQYIADLEEVEQLRELITHKERALENTRFPKNRALLESELAKYRARLMSANARIEKRDSSNLLMDKVNFHSSNMHANGLEELAISIGQWFETGVVGPGTVTYRDMTFTAE